MVSERNGMAKLLIRQVRSTIGRHEHQEKVLVALGITRMGLVVEHEDTPQIRGMIRKVEHLVDVSEVAE
jgi:large subunit ribosomal protein L30